MSEPNFLDLTTQGGESTSAPTTTGTGTPADPGGGPPPRSSPPGGFLIPAVAMFAIFYFLLIRPEKKRRQRTEEMLGALKKGDRVMTSSGMYAQVAAINGDEVTLQIADGVRVKFSRSAVQGILGAEGEAGSTGS